MKNNKSLFWDTIRIFSQNDILTYVILIGSWVEYIYEVSNYFKSFKASLKTKDVDFLIKNIRKPNYKINIVSILEKEGYLVDIDYISEIFKFYKDKDLEIEFLVREIGKGQSEPYDVISFGIKAEGLRNTDILVNNVLCLKVRNFYINVPTPQAYVLQKMIISDQRKNKAEKDYLGIENLLDHIKESSVELHKLRNLYNELSKKQRKKVDEFCKINVIELFR